MTERAMTRGDSFVFNVQVTLDGVPQDITGWKMWFTAKRNLADADSQAVSQLTNGTSAIVFTQPTSGKAQITMPPLATRGFADSPVTLFYDVQTLDLLGRVATIDSGTLVVSPDVTRAIS